MVARIVITREIDERNDANLFLGEVENALYSVYCDVSDVEVIEDDEDEDEDEDEDY